MKYILITLCLIMIAGAAIFFLPSTSARRFDDRLHVVTTVAPLTNIIQNIAGSDAVVTGIIPEGTDSHTFEPSPSDAVTLSEADILFLNGLHLETPTESLANKNKKASAQIVFLGDQTIQKDEWQYDFSFPKDQGNPNPHLWMNPVYVKRYAEIVATTLSTRDPRHKYAYMDRFRAYSEKIDALDNAIKSSIQTIPQDQRKLLTYHDSWAYFATRYGMTVIGAIQPSDFSEPSPREVASFIDQIKREKVPAIFGSEVFPSVVMDQIGKEGGVKWVTTLRDDDLPGKKEDREHTYIGMMKEDVQAMVTSLGGSATMMGTVDASNL